VDRVEGYRRSLKTATQKANAASVAALDVMLECQIQPDMQTLIQRSIELMNPPRHYL